MVLSLELTACWARQKAVVSAGCCSCLTCFSRLAMVISRYPRPYSRLPYAQPPVKGFPVDRGIFFYMCPSCVEEDHVKKSFLRGL